MRTVAISVAVLLATAALACGQSTSTHPPYKPPAETLQCYPDGRTEGDTVEECWTIPSLPFYEAGSTCGFANDYDEMCPYGGQYGPDVVYGYTPPYDMCVSISLCNSYFDTKLYVYTEGWMYGTPWACNDDYNCVDPPVMYTSSLPEVPLTAGQTYYIVVDAYGSDCGDYVLEVDEVECYEPCDIVCEGVSENEPTCYHGYVDVYNGGCATDSYLLIPVGDEPFVVCGESGVFGSPAGFMRDTDWYLIYPCGGVPITVTVEAEFSVFLSFLDLRGGCENVVPYSYVQADACEPAVLSEYVPMGRFAVFVAPDYWNPEYECGVEYSMTVEGYTEDCNPTAVETRSWGAIKAIYR